MTGFGVRPRCLLLLAAALGLSLVCAALFGVGWGAALLFHGAALAVLLADFALTPGAGCFSARRELPALEQNRPAQVRLLLDAPTVADIPLRVADTPPETFRARREPMALALAGGAARCEYPLTPTRRGSFAFGRVYVEAQGRWGLAVRRFSLECPSQAAVYPNLAPMRYYRMLAEKNQLTREDASLHRVRGAGSEFVGIREYAPDDDWSRVNWKATARTGKLMTNQYDIEKNRDVVLAVDTGRWMQASTGGVTRLDRALEMAAALMQVALSSGDRVGLALYDAQVSTYLPPGKGAVQAGRILGALYEAKPSPNPSSFSALSALLHHKLNKRAFVCVLTYLDNPHEAGVAVGELAPIKRRHALYLGSLTDEGLEALIAKEAAAPEDLYLKTAAAHRKLSVLGAVETLRRNGVGAHAAEPSELLTRSVRQYLQATSTP